MKLMDALVSFLCISSIPDLTKILPTQLSILLLFWNTEKINDPQGGLDFLKRFGSHIPMGKFVM